MLTTTRLTKRQKKGVAFRERKHGKRKGDPLDTLDDETNVPSLKDQAPPAATQDQQGCQVGAEALVGRGEAGEANGQRMVVAARKRKRKTEEEKGEQPKLKRRKGPDESPLIGASEAFAEDHVGVGEAEKESEREKQRFILFLGMHLSVVHTIFSLLVRQSQIYHDCRRRPGAFLSLRYVSTWVRWSGLFTSQKFHHPLYDY